VVTSLRRRDIIGDEIDDISGLYFKAPVEALLMLVFLLSLAGIPPMAGFYGKYFIFLALIQSGNYVVAVVAVLFAVLALYYYARIFNQMFMKKEVDSEPVAAGWGMRLALGITGMATIAVGILPNGAIRAVEWTIPAAANTMAQLLK
jgi:NADH-quinone oxidoreductase subunit N